MYVAFFVGVPSTTSPSGCCRLKSVTDPLQTRVDDTDLDTAVKRRGLYLEIIDRFTDKLSDDVHKRTSLAPPRVERCFKAVNNPPSDRFFDKENPSLLLACQMGAGRRREPLNPSPSKEKCG